MVLILYIKTDADAVLIGKVSVDYIGLTRDSGFYLLSDPVNFTLLTPTPHRSTHVELQCQWLNRATPRPGDQSC